MNASRLVNSVPNPPKIITHLSAPTQPARAGLIDPGLLHHNGEVYTHDDNQQDLTSNALGVEHTSEEDDSDSEEEGINDIPSLNPSGSASLKRDADSTSSLTRRRKAIKRQKARLRAEAEAKTRPSLKGRSSDSARSLSAHMNGDTGIGASLQMMGPKGEYGGFSDGGPLAGIANGNGNGNGNGSAHPTPRPSPTVSHNHSPLLRNHPNRPLSPDLPYRDALYLFCNYSSYMRSPGEGAEGAQSEDFRDSVRLLEYARALAAQPHNNIHVLHLKYRFEQPLDYRSTAGVPVKPQAQQKQDQQQQQQQQEDRVGSSLPPSGRNGSGSVMVDRTGRGARLRMPVPQPFSVLHDMVVKVDYRNDGVFEPLPAQAIFTHIAQACHPPPRIIVVSYVGSTATQNHLASLSTWARASSPPIYIFSPLETRIRETQDLTKSLMHAIPISMYASPYGPITPSPSALTGGMASGLPQGETPRLARRHSDASLHPAPSQQTNTNTAVSKLSRPSISYSHSASWRSPDPIASMTVITDPPRLSTSRSYTHTQQRPSLAPDPAGNEADQPDAQAQAQSQPHQLHRHGSELHSPGQMAGQQIERIPLWALAPGVGVLHGSTSASIGVKLEDFSAINIGKTAHHDHPLNAYDLSAHPQPSVSHSSSRLSDERHGKALRVHVDTTSNRTLTGGGVKGGMVRHFSIADLAGITVASNNLDLSGLGPVNKPALTVEGILQHPSTDTESSTSRPITPVNKTHTIGNLGPFAFKRNIDETSTARVVAVASLQVQGGHAQYGQHLTPPDRLPTNLFSLKSRDDHAYPLDGQGRYGSASASWSTPRARVGGWRKGRKEHVEDVLEEMEAEADIGDIAMSEESTRMNVHERKGSGDGDDHGMRLELERGLARGLRGLAIAEAGGEQVRTAKGVMPGQGGQEMQGSKELLRCLYIR